MNQTNRDREKRQGMEGGNEAVVLKIENATFFKLI